MKTHQNIISKTVLTDTAIWSNAEKIGFRFAFLFFILLIIPLDWKWYERLFGAESFYNILSSLAGYRATFVQVATESGRWGVSAYASWGIAFLIASLGTAIWTIASRSSRRKEYNVLYYWLRVIVRYRIAIGLIAFGYLKFFPMQMSFPSIANLNTDFGDYAPFKLYWQVVGLSLPYQIFLGVLEIAAGFLMFFRGTTALGAIINAGVLFNIAHANLAYDGAVHVYSSYFVLLSLFLLIQYVPNIWRLFIKKKVVKPDYYYPRFETGQRKAVYYGLKIIFLFSFVMILGYYQYDARYNKGALKEPVVPGLPAAKGHYAVNKFVLNGDTIPYSPNDSLRWHDAFFERYSTFVYKTNKAFDIDVSNGTPHRTDLFKAYELTGRAGGKVYLYYEIDSVHHALYLVNKSQDFGAEFEKKYGKENTINLKKLYTTGLKDSIGILKWQYDRPEEDRIILSGIDLNKDSISVVLDKTEDTYYTGKEWYVKNNAYIYK